MIAMIDGGVVHVSSLRVRRTHHAKVILAEFCPVG